MTNLIVVEPPDPPRPGFVLPTGARKKGCINGHKWTEQTMIWNLITNRHGIKQWVRRCKICVTEQQRQRYQDRRKAKKEVAE